VKLPKTTETEQANRASSLERASKHAAVVPLETAELAAEVERLLNPLRAITIPQAASDLSVAQMMAEAARCGSLENVRVNLSSIQDQDWVQQIAQQVQSLDRD
jgi:formiminotetrahydrofolate cyclodeaminase